MMHARCGFQTCFLNLYLAAVALVNISSVAGSSKGFFDSAVGSQFGRSESPAKSAPTRAAPKQAAASKPSSGGFFGSAEGFQFERSESPAKSAPTRAAPKGINHLSNDAQSSDHACSVVDNAKLCLLQMYLKSRGSMIYGKSSCCKYANHKQD